MAMTREEFARQAASMGISVEQLLAAYNSSAGMDNLYGTPLAPYPTAPTGQASNTYGFEGGSPSPYTHDSSGAGTPGINSRILTGSTAGPSGDNESYNPGGSGVLRGQDPYGANPDGFNTIRNADGTYSVIMDTGRGSSIAYGASQNPDGTFTLSQQPIGPEYQNSNNNNDFYRNTGTVLAAAAGAGGLMGGFGAATAGGVAGSGTGTAGISGSTIGTAMSGAEVAGGALSAGNAATTAASLGMSEAAFSQQAASLGMTTEELAVAYQSSGMSGTSAAAAPTITATTSSAPSNTMLEGGSDGIGDGSGGGDTGPDAQLRDAYSPDTAGLDGQEGLQSGYPATQTTDTSILNYLRQIPGFENLTNEQLMRAAASLGLGAVSAAGPSSQTTSSQTSNDPATDAYLAQIRQRATGIANQPPAQAPSATTSTAGVQGAVEDLRPAQQVQNTWLNESNDLVRQGTTPGTSAQNGLLGDVRAMMAESTAPRTAAVNAYAGQDNPYTQQTIDYAAGDMNRAYANNVAPRFASGSSFGSSGLGFAEVMARDDLLRRQGQMASEMRMTDLTAQQKLAEQGAQRQDNISNLRSQLNSTNANNLGTFGSQDAQRADNMYTNNANRSLTGASQMANNSLIPMNTATTIANAQGNLWGLNNNNTNQATDAYRWGQDYPMRQQEMLVNSIGRGGQNTSTTTPNGSAASRFVGGTLAGWQGWNNLTQQRGSSNTGRTAT